MHEKQLDLFTFVEKDDDTIHRLRIEHEKLRKSFFVRYNSILKELDKIQSEIDWLQAKQQDKKNENSKKETHSVM